MGVEGLLEKIEFQFFLLLLVERDFPPMLALQMAYGFLPPLLLLTLVTHLSNFFVLSPFFLPLGILLAAHYY
jgi:hypothetical protein